MLLNEYTRILERYHGQLKKMCIAGLESVYWRQDQFNTGGIVESDIRVDDGRNLYWPWCWPRTYIVEPLLAVGKFDRVRKFCDYWLKCQREDGSWLHCYDIRDHSEFPGWPETDNVGYMLQHFGNYVTASDDRKWLDENYPAIKKAADFLCQKYNPEMNLIWGQEEAHIPGKDKLSIRYSLHINCVCALGLKNASKLAAIKGGNSAADQYNCIAEEILNSGIKNRLWDNEEKTFSHGFCEDGTRVTAAMAWMAPMPFWLFDRFDDRISDVLDYMKKHLYNKDPKIKRTYWGYDYSPIFDSGSAPGNKYSGVGVWIGGVPVIIYAALKAGRFDHASEQLEKLIECTNPENNLVPEHINTIHPGELGNYSVYPEPHYHVDSGNLLHLSFFLTLIARLDRQMLKQASQEADKLIEIK